MMRTSVIQVRSGAWFGEGRAMAATGRSNTHRKENIFILKIPLSAMCDPYCTLSPYSKYGPSAEKVRPTEFWPNDGTQEGTKLLLACRPFRSHRISSTVNHPIEFST